MTIRSALLCSFLFTVTGCDQSAEVRRLEQSSSTSEARKLERPSSTSEVRKIKDPFPNASEVRLFVEVDYPKESGNPIFSKENGVILSDADRLRFEDALRFVPMPEAMAACFVPHHFFRYFDDKGKQVGEVAVCFCCAGTSASGGDKLKPEPDEILDADMKALEALVLDLGESTQVLCE
ncbi:hypothetical protein LY632_03540 [Erythrobacter sp. SDW2]|uniref:hypothetical protein n=1 Tax=Erythrobacter sp. SDW2 TaxID=2907154 RepID=UPI001F43F1FD|nr:hypothetical protein [Erythrobacter sp. SDW2]UIP07484.1 hypothetical protein LY632_03540 [Erythrobacter sp. SDW2]